MRKGTLRNLLDSSKLETGGDDIQAAQLASDRLADLFEAGKVQPDDFSVKAMFEELVDPKHEFNHSTDAKVLQEAVTSSAFPTITNTVINAAIIPAYELAVGPAARLVSEAPATKTSREEVAGYTSGGQFAVRREHMSYEEDTLSEKYWSIDKADFGKIISLTREAIFDDRTGDLINRARIMGEKGGQLRAKIITKTLEVGVRTEYGESASQAAVYKGTANTAAVFYSATHAATIDSAGINQNLVTSNGLGVAGALNTTNALFSKMKDESGDEIGVVADTLIYPPDLFETAKELLADSSKRSVQGASRVSETSANVWQGRFEPIELPFLSSTSTWYLGSPKKQMLWLWVWKPETKVQTENSESAFHAQIVLRYRFSFNGGCGHTDYRFIAKNTA